MYSDMQAGHGGLYGLSHTVASEYLWPNRRYGGHPYVDVPKLIQRYRVQVNPHVMVYLVQVAGYEDTIAPETYERTAIIGGWSTELLRYAARFADVFNRPQQ